VPARGRGQREVAAAGAHVQQHLRRRPLGSARGAARLPARSSGDVRRFAPGYPAVRTGAPEAEETTFRFPQHCSASTAQQIIELQVRNTNRSAADANRQKHRRTPRTAGGASPQSSKTPTARGIHPDAPRPAGRARCCAPSPPSEPTSASTTLGPRPGASAACQRPHAASVAATSTPACARRHPVRSPHPAKGGLHQAAGHPCHQRGGRARFRPNAPAPAVLGVAGRWEPGQTGSRQRAGLPEPSGPRLRPCCGGAKHRRHSPPARGIKPAAAPAGLAAQAGPCWS